LHTIGPYLIFNSVGKILKRWVGFSLTEEIVNRNYFLIVLVLVNFANRVFADNEQPGAEGAGVTTLAPVAAPTAPISFSDVTEMIRNMTPEQRKDFDEYVDTLQGMYGSQVGNDGALSSEVFLPEKTSQALAHGAKEESFLVEDPKDLLGFNAIVGGAPDSVQLTVKALKRKRSGMDTMVNGKRKTIPGRLLLYGPPGTGKTTLAAAIAHEWGAKFMRIKAPSLNDGYIATGRIRIENLFRQARELNEPVVVFIDEVDAFAGARRKETNEEYKITMLALLLELDECARLAPDRVFVILATNKFALLDDALQSRFSNTAIELKAPTGDLGQQIMLHYLNDYDHEPITRVTWAWIKFWTRGFSGREYENMVNKAYLFAGDGKIKKEHLIKAMNESCAARKSSDSEKDSWFKKFTEKYASPWGTAMSAITYTSAAGGIALSAYYGTLLPLIARLRSQPTDVPTT